jgi:hypothetical protein
LTLAVVEAHAMRWVENSETNDPVTPGRACSRAAEFCDSGHGRYRRWTEREPGFGAAVEQAEAEARSMLVNILLAAAAKRMPNT